MNKAPVNLKNYLAASAASSSLVCLLCEMAAATKEISALVLDGALADIYGKLCTENVQGETQATLDVISDKIITDRLASTGLVAGMVSEEVVSPIMLEDQSSKHEFLVIFDPLDGSSNVDVNVSIGTIFSVFNAPENTILDTAKLIESDYLITGDQQLAAGYANYGPCTMLVITIGDGTHGFTLDHTTNEFLLTHSNIQVPENAQEYAINNSNQRFWQPPIKRYIAECEAGTEGVRGKNFNMRWIASMVADVHRVLMRGGVYLYPKDSKDATKAGRLRLMYEANPMAMLIEQAGGAASTGRARILDVQPEAIHQRIPVMMGSKNEIDLLVRYHQEHDKN
jgi:fructose-1,6-bisphosphatase I / sedoheptulose-1,7-bisphosphatase